MLLYLHKTKCLANVGRRHLVSLFHKPERRPLFNPPSKGCACGSVCVYTAGCDRCSHVTTHADTWLRYTNNGNMSGMLIRLWATLQENAGCNRRKRKKKKKKRCWWWNLIGAWFEKVGVICWLPVKTAWVKLLFLLKNLLLHLVRCLWAPLSEVFRVADL